MSADERRSLFRNFDPSEPLKPGDPRYIDFDTVRDHKIVTPLVRRFRDADPAGPISVLFSGHRGTGKTSVLLRIAKQLQDLPNDEKFLVVYTDVTDVLDLEDFAYQDFLVFLATELMTDLQEANIPGFDTKSAFMKGLWDNFSNLLQSEVDLTGVDVVAGPAKIKTEFKSHLSAFKNLREEIQRQSSTIIAGLNDVLNDAQVASLRTDI